MGEKIFAWGFSMAALVVTAALMLSSCEPRKTISAPLKACTKTRTGATREQQVTTMQCFGMDAKGNCNVQMPVTSYHTEHQVRIQCDWTEWH